MLITLPAVIAAVKAAPMTIPMKEAILDQLVGHHDDLYAKDVPARKYRPLFERTVEASRIGAFDKCRVEPNGDIVYLYFKSGVPAYELIVRDGAPVQCGCDDFQRKVRWQPDYLCKHCDLWITMRNGLETLVEKSGEAAKAYMLARQRLRLGQGSAEDVMAALNMLREVEARIGCFLPGEGERATEAAVQSESSNSRPMAMAA